MEVVGHQHIRVQRTAKALGELLYCSLFFKSQPLLHAKFRCGIRQSVDALPRTSRPTPPSPDQISPGFLDIPRTHRLLLARLQKRVILMVGREFDVAAGEYETKETLPFFSSEE
jgi:hypothetical protein